MEGNLAHGEWVIATSDAHADMNDKEKDTIYRSGFNAGLTGKSLDACRYRLAEKKAVWVRAFREGELQAQFNQLSKQERADANRNIEQLRALLESNPEK
jgi:ribosome modulation factor